MCHCDDSGLWYIEEQREINMQNGGSECRRDERDVRRKCVQEAMVVTHETWVAQMRGCRLRRGVGGYLGAEILPPIGTLAAR